MITMDQLGSLNGIDVYGADDDKIGSVGQVWNDGNGQPTWASVRTGVFGLSESLAPLQEADLRDDRLVLPFDKDKVKHAPDITATSDEPLTAEDVERLSDYYGLNWQASNPVHETAGDDATIFSDAPSADTTTGYGSADTSAYDQLGSPYGDRDALTGDSTPRAQDGRPLS